jgi:hypothetical protein
MKEIDWHMFGGLEDDERDPDRMVVRILGQRIGTCLGWMHFDGHAIIMPQFKREPGLLFFMKDQDLPEKTAVVVDYYAGLLAICEEPTKQIQTLHDLKMVWSTTLVGGPGQ